MAKKVEAEKAVEAEEQPDKIEAESKKVMPVVDLTSDITGQWPGNTPHRIGHFYFNLNKLTLSQGQKALIGSTAENFVFERADIHGIEAPETTTDIELLLEDGDNLGRFVMEESSKNVKRVREDDLWQIQPGTFMSKKRIFLKLNNQPAQKGRIVINFVGYLIEPWR